MSIYDDSAIDAADLAKLVNEDTDVTTRYGANPKVSAPKAIRLIEESGLVSINELAKNFNLTDAGFDFATGGVINSYNQLVKDSNGNSWQWQGDLPHTVQAGTLPSSPDYEQRTFNEAANVSKSGGGNVQGYINNDTLHTSIDDAANSFEMYEGKLIIATDRDFAAYKVTSGLTPNGIDIIQIRDTGLSLAYQPDGSNKASHLGVFPSESPNSLEDFSAQLFRAAEIAGSNSVSLKAGGYNTGVADFTGLNFTSYGNARSYQTTTLRAVDLSQSRNDKPIGNSVIDMHYSVLRGTGARTGEAQSGGTAGSSDLSFNVSAQASIGSKSIELTSSGALIAGQLIAYEGDNGEFYTAKIESINSDVLSLGDELEAAIDIGDNVYAFYRNDYHPSDTGYKAIADHSLREMRTKRTVLERVDLTQRGTGTTTPITVNDQSNPGSYRPVTPEAEVLSYDVTSPGTSISANGAQAVFSPKMAGQYEIQVVVNTQGQDVGLSWFSDGGYSRSITVNNDSPTLYKVPAFVYGDSGSLTLTLGTSVDGGAFKAKASAHLVYVESRDFNVNRGTHVFMGDSWFFEGPLVDRLKERLPNAVIFNKGVGGEKAADINARFQTDATPLKPDFVWFMSGTNDWFGFVDPTLFAYQLGQFKSYCKDIGATCLMFTGSVAPDANLADQWSWSRAYQEFSYYEDEVLPEKTPLHPITINVPAGVPVQLGRYGNGNKLTILEHYLNSDCNVIESSSLVGNENQTLLPTGFNGGANVTINPSAAKFIRLESANAGYLIIKGNPTT